MARSAAYACIKADVLRIVAAVPHGRLVTHAAVGAHLDVVPRHVAYILAMLSLPEKSAVPWHRVVGADGALGAGKYGTDGRPQADWLRDEGHAVDGAALAPGYVERLVEVAALRHGVPRQVRPATATTRTRHARPRTPR